MIELCLGSTVAEHWTNFPQIEGSNPAFSKDITKPKFIKFTEVLGFLFQHFPWQ